MLLWFPFFFGQLLPGWVFNIAGLVHGEEALARRGLHLYRSTSSTATCGPDKFPMDTVIFTGSISEHELKTERAVEYASPRRKRRRLRLRRHHLRPPQSRVFGWIVGGATVVLGIVVILLIIYSVVFQ